MYTRVLTYSIRITTYFLQFHVRHTKVNIVHGFTFWSDITIFTPITNKNHTLTRTLPLTPSPEDPTTKVKNEAFDQWNLTSDTL